MSSGSVEAEADGTSTGGAVVSGRVSELEVDKEGIGTATGAGAAARAGSIFGRYTDDRLDTNPEVNSYEALDLGESAARAQPSRVGVSGVGGEVETKGV